MATAALKTYHGNTMADALAQVKKDLGSEAVILHTRNYKVGGVMGMGARGMVEITAAADSASIMPRRLRPAPQRQGTMGQNPKPTGSTPIGSPPIEQHARLTHLQSTTSEAGHTISPTKPASGEAFIARPPWFEQKQTETSAAASHSQPASRMVQNPILDPKIFSVRDTREEAQSARNRLLSDDTTQATARGYDDQEPSRQQYPERVRSSQKTARGVSRLSAGTIISPVPTNPKAHAALEDELVAIKRLVGQVLQSTRRVEVRTGQARDLAGNGPQLASQGALFDLYMKLLDNQVSTEVADRLSTSVRESLTSDDLADAAVVREAMLREIARLIPAAPQPTPAARTQTDRPMVIALLGPTGVGKTTTVAKLAANYKLKYGRRVGLITADTYRIAAVEQLRTYADIVGLPLKVALTPQDMADAIESLTACDIVLVDTAGRSQHDTAKLGELAAFLEAAQPDERHLVLSLGAAESVIVRAAERFGGLGAAHVILSKLDEAVDFGVIANIASRIGLPMSFVTTGQEVPDHIESADASRLARLVLDGPQAWKGLMRDDPCLL